MTKKEKFEAIVEILNEQGETDLANTMVDEIARVVKHNSYRSSTPTKKQKENEAIKETLLNVLDSTPTTIDDIMAKDSTLPQVNQRVSALLGQLVEDGKVKREYIKRKAHFSVV